MCSGCVWLLAFRAYGKQTDTQIGSICLPELSARCRLPFAGDIILLEQDELLSHA